MASVTAAGRLLAEKLNPSIGTTREILEVCSLICRSAKTYQRIQEMVCSVEMSEAETARLEKREAQLERRIRELVDNHLPTVDGQFIKVKFQGDPRGFTVTLVMPDGRYDTLGGAEEGLGVPNS